MNTSELASAGGRPAPSYVEALAARLIEASLARIVPDPRQPRKTFDPVSIRGLASNIEQHGLQNPVHVWAAEGDELMLISGARRVEAYKLLGHTHIPAFLHSGPLGVEEKRLVQVSENLCREDVNPMEQALALKECLNGGTASALAKKLGIAVSTVTRAIELVDKLPADVQELMRQGAFPGTVARELTRAPSDEQKSELARLYVSGELKTREQVRAAVQRAGFLPAPAAASFTFQESSGVKISVTLPGQDPSAAEPALRQLLKALRDHGGAGLGPFKDYLEKRGIALRKAAELQAAKAALAST